MNSQIYSHTHSSAYKVLSNPGFALLYSVMPALTALDALLLNATNRPYSYAESDCNCYALVDIWVSRPSFGCVERLNLYGQLRKQNETRIYRYYFRMLEFTDPFYHEKSELVINVSGTESSSLAALLARDKRAYHFKHLHLHNEEFYSKRIMNRQCIS